MQTINCSDQLNVLITRPTPKAKALAQQLAVNNIASFEQPLFDYQPLADNQTSARLLTGVDIIIFVSTAAVEFAHVKFAAQNWHGKVVIAVGKATQKALHTLGINHVICPNQENSEGVLALPVLSEPDSRLCEKVITIVRGNDGRELLANQLKKRGATVNYLESYQLVWRAFTKDMSKQWFNQQINCIVVTSNAILEKMMALTVSQAKRNNDSLLTRYWRDQCLWVVTSQRVYNNAKALGLTSVVISNGAHATNVTATLQQQLNNHTTDTT